MKGCFVVVVVLVGRGGGVVVVGGGVLLLIVVVVVVVEAECDGANVCRTSCWGMFADLMVIALRR